MEVPKRELLLDDPTTNDAPRAIEDAEAIVRY
jgi:hypothetical protein